MCAFSPQPSAWPDRPSNHSSILTCSKMEGHDGTVSWAVGTWGRKHSSEGCCVSAISLSFVGTIPVSRRLLREPPPDYVSVYSAPPPCAQPLPRISRLIVSRVRGRR